MRFWKGHGAANDFVLLRDPEDDLDLPAELVRALCDRRRGLGADGVLRLGRPPAGADVFMDYRNADGSIGELCGNGVRVVAKHVVDHGLVRGDEVLVATRAGVKRVTVQRGPDGTVAAATVDMGPPVLDPAQVPFDAADPTAAVHPLELRAGTLDVVAVSMGNPHAVTLVDDVRTAPVGQVGPEVERHRRFPRGANVGFVERVDEGRVRLRVWERGVGETAACGTGACAAVVALQRLGRVDGQVAVELPGGTLTIAYRPGDPGVLMTGPAVEVATGTLDAAWLAAARTATPTPDAEVLR